MTEIARDMVRIRRLLKLRLMTWVAIRVNELVVSIRMARLTLRGNMSSREGEPGCIMIECCATPLDGTVTGLACRWEIRRHVIRVQGLLIVRSVAAHTLRW